MRHLRHHGETVDNRADLEACIARGLPAVDEWIDDCVDALAPALRAVLCVVDAPVVVLDADTDAGLLDAVTTRLRAALVATAPEARGTPVLVRGTFGADAGAIGAATLPMFFNFSPRAGILKGARTDSRRSTMSRSELPRPLLEMRGISKTFPAVRALDNVSLTVYPGEIHSLMGENGAGKSTLMKILSGAYRADAGGEILIDRPASTSTARLPRAMQASR